jgi:hypothetical protein
VTTDVPMLEAMRDRRSRLVPALAAMVIAAGWAAAGSAGAAITSFTLSPTSGAPSTVVGVSGAGCSPGFTVSASDYVLVTAPTLQISTRVPVVANGSWHGSFTVPAGATPLASPVAALCVSDGLPSLLTLYTPQTFTVTAPPTTTAPTTTPGTTHPTTPTTPTTQPRESGGTTPPPGTQPPNGGAGPGATLPVSGGSPPSDGGGSNGGSHSGSADGGSARNQSGAGTVDVEHAMSAAARAADLSAPELPTAHVGGSSGLGWLSWLLVLALLVAMVATPFWIRRTRRAIAEGGDLGAEG